MLLAKTVSGPSTGIEKNGSPSNDMVFVDLDKNIDSSCSAKATLSRAFADILRYNRF